MTTVTEEMVRHLEDDPTGSQPGLYQFFEIMPVGIFIVLPGGRPHYVNREAVRLLGRGILPAANGEQLPDAYQVYRAGTNDLYPAERVPVMRALAGEMVHVDDIDIHWPDGTIMPVECWATPVTGPAGSVDYAICVFVDVSARRRVESALASHVALLELANDGVFVRDNDGRITYWNTGAEQTYGYRRAEALGRLSHELLETRFPVPLAEIEATVAALGRWEGGLFQRRSDGQFIEVESRWAANRTPDGRLLGVMEVNRDIMTVRAVEVELARKALEVKQANVRLERSNRELEQFAYIASHDLAEPLRAISGPISLLARRYHDQLDPEADQFIDFAVDGCRRMQAMIDDLLAYSRSGRVDGQKESVDCNLLLNSVTAALALRIGETKAVVTIDPLPTVAGERLQLAQVFQNLMSNALKFLPEGVIPEVTVSAEHLDTEWRFTVTDNGIGIEPRHRERIFGMFKRLHGRGEYPGTGIGLALCKRIVERNGGRIGVEDAPGAGAGGTGTRFWFTLPIPQEEIS